MNNTWVGICKTSYKFLQIVQYFATISHWIDHNFPMYHSAIIVSRHIFMQAYCQMIFEYKCQLGIYKISYDILTIILLMVKKFCKYPKCSVFSNHVMIKSHQNYVSDILMPVLI